jgi:hypothetical protein
MNSCVVFIPITGSEIAECGSQRRQTCVDLRVRDEFLRSQNRFLIFHSNRDGLNSASTGNYTNAAMIHAADGEFVRASETPFDLSTTFNSWSMNLFQVLKSPLHFRKGVGLLSSQILMVDLSQRFPGGFFSSIHYSFPD